MSAALEMSPAVRALLLSCRAQLVSASDMIEDAVTTHIYDDEDDVPADCGYLGEVEAERELIKQIDAAMGV